MFEIFKTNCNIKINNDWYNVKPFLKLHPGGNKILQKYHMKDASDAFFSITAHQNYIQALDIFLITVVIFMIFVNHKLRRNVKVRTCLKH